MSLFDKNLDLYQPLARKMRPRTVEEFVGQEHVLGEGKVLRRIILSGKMTSMIFFGPPGTGKTAMANILADLADAEFVVLNAVTSGVADIRKASQEAGDRLKMRGRRTLLFIDEIHRFNKSQQDALLPDVENGQVILIGATTHNPSFYVTAALASRTTFIEFKPLSVESIVTILRRASDLRIAEDALRHIAEISDGDARRALTALELVAVSAPDREVTVADVTEALGRKVTAHDRDEDLHYDVASAFIKSMRGSDPDAAIYYLARMIEGGDDPRFLARRMAIFASEDVGNADPQALLVATAAHAALEFVGLPEARIILSQCAAYLATAPKSNASYLAIDEALSDIRSGRVLQVPNHLRGKTIHGRGEGYEYPHATGGFVKQDYLSEPRSFYRPTENGREKKMGEHLKALWGRWPR